MTPEEKQKLSEPLLAVEKAMDVATRDDFDEDSCVNLTLGTGVKIDIDSDQRDRAPDIVADEFKRQ